MMRIITGECEFIAPDFLFQGGFVCTDLLFTYNLSAACKQAVDPACMTIAVLATS